jgi:hypothetical protein
LLTAVADDRLIGLALDLDANDAARRMIDNLELELALVVCLGPEAPLQDNWHVGALGGTHDVEPACCDDGQGKVGRGQGAA